MQRAFIQNQRQQSQMRIALNVHAKQGNVWQKRTL